jgi:hypothetical protein
MITHHRDRKQESARAQGCGACRAVNRARYLAGVGRWLTPVPAVEYLKAARSLAIDDKIQMRLAQFNLADVPGSSSGVYFSQISASRKAPSTSFLLSDFAKQNPSSDLTQGRWSGGAG